MTELDQALTQLAELESFWTFINGYLQDIEQAKRSHPAYVRGSAVGFLVDSSLTGRTPEAKIDALGARLFKPAIWHGLGIVGIYAALDAFAERRTGKSKRLGSLSSKLPQKLATTLREIEDMRDLFAHNFGGIADAAYFNRHRHLFKEGKAYTLSSGQVFDGERLQLTLDDLKFYIDQGRAILKELDEEKAEELIREAEA